MTKQTDEFSALLSTLFRPHPWHGISAGDEAPRVVKAYIEIHTTSPVKLELSKADGTLAVDRPQRFSSLCPTLYGFVPQTYCGETIGKLCADRTGRRHIEGDGDPLDICVLTEKDFSSGDILLKAKPIGGLRMIDKGQADDKIIAVLVDDIEYGGISEIAQCQAGVVERLKHYFLSYKQPPDQPRTRRSVEITEVYGRREAYEVIRRSMADYEAKFGRPEDRIERLRQILTASLVPPIKKSPRRRKSAR